MTCSEAQRLLALAWLMPACMVLSQAQAQTPAPAASPATTPATAPTAKPAATPASTPTAPAPLDAATLAQVLALLPAQPGELVLLPALRGVVLVNSAEEAAGEPGGGSGIDVSRVAIPELADLAGIAPHLIGKPASFASLERIATLVRAQLRLQGRRFVLVYLPPQNLGGDSVRIVVQQVRLDGAMGLEGNTHFSPGQYAGVLGLKAGETIDEARVDAALERLNRNPFRRASLVAQAGSRPGTTRLALSLQERRPLAFQLGMDNGGSRNTGQHRLSAGITWGDAFGRGDVLGYNYKTDPQGGRMHSHSASYTHQAAQGTYSLNGAWSVLKPDLGPLFGQTGHTWQLSGRYGWAAPAPQGWSAQWSVGPDLKYSDNTIEFAAVPVLNNRTRIVQAQGSYALQRASQGASTDATLALVASPGGIGADNSNTAFSGSRLGASARYAYARGDFNHRQTLGASGWSWRAFGTVQLASGPLLGSEQLGGAGAGAVRAFRENAAFGDRGLLASVQLHLPRLGSDSSSVDSFVFADTARLLQHGGAAPTRLSGAGVGMSLAWGQSLSVNASYGRTLDRPAGYDGSGRWNVNARLAF